MEKKFEIAKVGQEYKVTFPSSRDDLRDILSAICKDMNAESSNGFIDYHCDNDEARVFVAFGDSDGPEYASDRLELDIPECQVIDGEITDAIVHVEEFLKNYAEVKNDLIIKIKNLVRDVLVQYTVNVYEEGRKEYVAREAHKNNLDGLTRLAEKAFGI